MTQEQMLLQAKVDRAFGQFEAELKRLRATLRSMGAVLRDPDTGDTSPFENAVTQLRETAVKPEPLAGHMAARQWLEDEIWLAIDRAASDPARRTDFLVLRLQTLLARAGAHRRAVVRFQAWTDRTADRAEDN